MRFHKNILLKNYTTFKIGGPAEYFCIAKNKNDLLKAVNFAKSRKLPFFILGGGSNLLVSDEGFGGLIIKLGITNYQLRIPEIRAGAGLTLAKLVSVAANAGLSGMEWASGIPGATIGGAVRGNAGAFETEIKDLIRNVEVFDIKDKKIKILGNKNCGFGYRNSIFKKNPNLIILSSTLELKKTGKVAVRRKTLEILNYRKSRHPFFPSAGSIFKNLENTRARDLIERAGLKGQRIGGAQISSQHTNFIVNLGDAKAKDVLDLIILAKKQVKNKFGIDIAEEIEIIK